MNSPPLLQSGGADRDRGVNRCSHADVSETRWKEINLPHTSTSPVVPSATARITILNEISAEAETRRPGQAPLPCVASVMCDL